MRLSGLEAVDFRGRFRPALDELAARLEAHAAPAARRRLPVPPWIAVLAAALGFVSLVPFVLADYGGSSLAYAIVATAGVWAVFFWLFPLAFARRRMSMLRLALTFAYVAAALAYLLLQLYASAPDLYGGATVRTARAVPWLPAAALAAALAGLATVLVVRPADLLRWTPTGGAWDVYRPQLTATAAAGHRTPAAFRLVHDDADAAAAERLRSDLLRSGATEGDAATPVLLLTNRTRPDWLDDRAELREGELRTVVATGVRVLPSLEWLWRRQVTDFRRWTPERATRPLVPEAFARLRPPPAVRTAHRVLCAFGALAFAAGGTIANAEGASSYAVAVGYAAAAAGTACALAAHLLFRRSPLLALAGRAAPAVALVTVAAGVLALQQSGAGAARLAAPAAFLAAAPLWLALRRGALRFWIPAPDRGKETLEPGRSWSTLLWFSGFAAAWMGILGGY